MASTTWVILNLAATGFSLALLIVTLIFLEQNVHGNEALIPDFNNTMFQFVYIGHWIVAGLTALGIVMALIAGGWFVTMKIKQKTASAKDSTTFFTLEELMADKKKQAPASRRKKRRAAPYQFIEL